MALVRAKIVFSCAVLVFACCQGETRWVNEPAEHTGLHRLTIGEAVVYVDIARASSAREQGLMYRKSLPENEGMLFVYARPGERSFYMKNTYIPLSLAYIDGRGEIFQLVQMEPLDETSRISEKPAQYVLEVNRGWFVRHGIQIGDKVQNLPSPEGAGW